MPPDLLKQWPDVGCEHVVIYMTGLATALCTICYGQTDEFAVALHRGILRDCDLFGMKEETIGKVFIVNSVSLDKTAEVCYIHRISGLLQLLQWAFDLWLFEFLRFGGFVLPVTDGI